jgi:hypothetical protein
VLSVCICILMYKYVNTIVYIIEDLFSYNLIQFYHCTQYWLNILRFARQLQIAMLGVLLLISIISGTWKANFSQLMPKLCKVCYSMRVIKPIMPTETLKMIYYSYFYSLLTYGIIFGGSSSFSEQISRIQKRIIRVMSGLPTSVDRGVSRGQRGRSPKSLISVF